MLTDTEKTNIKAELVTDSQTLGYAAHISSGSMSALKDLLNAPDPLAGVVERNNLTVREIHGAVVKSEYDALTTNDLTKWSHLLIAISNDGYQKGVGLNPMIKVVFNNSSLTWAAIKALQDKAASRVEAVINREYLINSKEITEILNDF